MKVLGIDPGSIVTGYGVVEKDGSRLIHVCDGEISIKNGAPLPERLLAISRELDIIIEEYRPDCVAVESVFFSRNVKSAIMLGHARGVCLLSAGSRGLEVFEYAPAVVKNSIVGYGNAAKVQVQKMVKLLLKAPTAPSPDAADALAVAICHINHLRPGGKLFEKSFPPDRLSKTFS